MLCKAEYVLVHICESFLISSFVKNARKEKVGKILENTATLLKKMAYDIRKKKGLTRADSDIRLSL